MIGKLRIGCCLDRGKAVHNNTRVLQSIVNNYTRTSQLLASAGYPILIGKTQSHALFAIFEGLWVGLDSNLPEYV